MKMIRVVVVSLCVICCLGWSLNSMAAKYDPLVEKAQQRLTELEYNPGPVDGKMGPKTIEAIKKFQQDQGLVVTGRLDEETGQKLGLSEPKPQQSPPNQSQLNTKLIKAVENGDVQLVKTVLQEGADINVTSKEGCTLLHIAANLGYSKVVELLIAHGADVNITCAGGLTPLHWAAMGNQTPSGMAVAASEGQKEVAEVLIAHGADMNAQEKDGLTPLHVALLYLDHAEFAKFKDSTDPKFENALYLTKNKTCREVARLLIEKGADLNVKDKEGDTPLDIAKLKNDTEIVKLIEERHATENSSPTNQATPKQDMSTAEEMSPEQFWKEFVSAFYANNAKRIHQLIIANPNTTEQVQQRLEESGEGTGEEAQQAHTLAKLLRKFRADDFSYIFNQLHEEAQQAYEMSDYQTALEKWQAGLNQARILNDKECIGIFLTCTGLAYKTLGQYERALESYEQALAIHRELGDRNWEGLDLTDIGNVYEDLEQYEQALEYFEQALVIRQKIGERQGEGANLSNIGIIYSKLGQYQRALKCFEQALEIDRELGDRIGEGNTLVNIGGEYRNLGQYEQALEYSEQALAIHRELGDRIGEGAALSNIGLVYEDLGQYQQALKSYEQILVTHRELDDRSGEGNTLSNLGIVYRNLGQYEQALESYEQALAIHREHGDRSGEGNTLSNLGIVYRNLGQYEQALESYEQALAIHREHGDRRGEGADLTGIGNVYNDLGRYERALKSYEQALAIHREHGDRSGEGKSLTGIGNVYQNLGQYEQALEFYKQALAIRRELGDRRGEGVALSNIGIVYGNLGQYQQALKYFEQALVIDRELGDRSGEGTDLSNLGNVYEALGQYERALESYEQALAICREIGDRSGEGTNLTNIGVVYDSLGQYQQALEKHEQALVICREIGYQRGEGGVLGNLGEVYENLGQYERALEYHEQALMITREIGDQSGEGNALTNISGVYMNLGQYPKALEYLEQALTIAHKLGNRREEGNALNGLGVVYAELGQYQRALEYLEQALVICREIGYQRGEGRVLGNLGGVCWSLGQYPRALESYKQALAICREIGDRSGEGMILGNIGAVYGRLGQYQRALEYLEQALAIRREIGDRRGEGDSLTNIGNVYTDLGQYQKAYTAIQDSLSIYKELGGILEGLWSAQRGLASVEVHLNQPESAIAHFEQALDTIEQLRAGLPEKEHKLSFMRGKLYVYDELIDLLQGLHQKHPDKGYDRKALEIFERKQGRVFLEEMGQSGARLFAGIPEAITQRELDLELQLEQTRKHLVDERAKIITEQNKELIQNLEKREKTLLSEQEALQKQIKTEYPDYYDLRYPKPVALAELQQDVLRPGELLLIYNVMEEKTVVWLVSSDLPLPLPGGVLSLSKGGESFRMYTLDVGEEEFQEKVAKLRRSMELEWKRSRGEIVDLSGDGDKQLTFAQLSHELYTILLPETIRPLLNEQHTLHVVPTGPLYALPFEALVTEKPTPNLSQADSDLTGKPTPNPSQEGNVHYLIEDIPISYLSSASLLKTLREAQARRKDSAPYPVLAFAHPIYPSSTKWSELKETAEEAEAIAKLLNASVESDPLQLRGKASLDNVRDFNSDKRLDDYQYLVFATHGALPGEGEYINQSGESVTINQSALVLSYPDKKDGYLTMADIFQLQLNAKLVSLSACNTGSGEQNPGVGVRGLTRPFMYAGTPAIAVTLWSVETFSAKELDIGLFDHLNKGTAPAYALRAIKLQMLRGEKGKNYTHPYYWAPFVLFGDPGATTEQVPWVMILIIGGITGVILLGVSWKLKKYKLVGLFVIALLIIAYLIIHPISVGIPTMIDRVQDWWSSVQKTTEPEKSTPDVLVITPTPDTLDVNEALLEAVKNGNVDAVRTALQAEVDIDDNSSGTTALIMAAQKGHTDIVRLLLEHHADANVSAGKGFTALMNAAYYGHVEIVELLLEHGADIDAKADDGKTALSFAKKKGHIEIVHLLEEPSTPTPDLKDAETDKSSGVAYLNKEEYQLKQLLFPEDQLPPNTKVVEIQDIQDIIEDLPFVITSNPYVSKERDFITQYSKEVFGESVNPENITEALLAFYEEEDVIGICAFRFTDSELAEEAKDEFPEEEEIFSIRKAEILVCIWHEGVSDSVFETFQAFIKNALPDPNKYLLEAAENGDFEGVQNPNEDLLEAAENGDFEGVQKALQSGADVNAANGLGDTALIRAADQGQLEIVKLLLEHGADVNVENNLGWTALMRAAEKRQLEIVKLLLEHGADVNIQEGMGRTALMYAVMGRQVEIAKLLLKHGANVYAKDLGGNTALKYAEGYNIEMVNLLKAVEQLNSELIEAVKADDVQLAETLLKKGADINVKSEKGWSPFEFSVYFQNLDMMEVLISHGADVNSTLGPDGGYPLHIAAYAAYTEKPQAVELLIRHGADINAQNENGDTPLHIATYRGKPQAVELLIRHGADINAQNENGDTPLHVAILQLDDEKDIEHQIVVERLISNGADINVKNKDGDTPLHLAIRAKQNLVATLLIAKGADVNAKSKSGSTPIQYAVANNNRDLVDLMEYRQQYAKESVKINEALAVVYNTLGYNSHKRFAGDNYAIEAYTQAITFNPKYAEAYSNRGFAYFREEEYDLAIADYTQVITLNLKDGGAYYWRGNIYDAKGEHDRAIADYTEAITLEPDFAWAYSGRGTAYFTKEEYDLAIADYTEAIMLDPKYALAYFNRGIAYDHQGQHDLAIEDFKKACDLGFERACKP